MSPLQISRTNNCIIYSNAIGGCCTSVLNSGGIIQFVSRPKVDSKHLNQESPAVYLEFLLIPQGAHWSALEEEACLYTDSISRCCAESSGIPLHFRHKR